MLIFYWVKRVLLVGLVLGLGMQTLGPALGMPQYTITIYWPSDDDYGVEYPTETAAQNAPSTENQAATEQTRTAQPTDATGEESDASDNGGGLFDAIKPLNESEVERLVHAKINEERRERGLSRLEYDPDLAEIARSHSEDMAKNEYFSHTAPGGVTMEDRYDQFGYNCRVQTGGNEYVTGAENILYTYYKERVLDSDGTKFYTTPQELAEGIVDQWMDSPGHRENILRPYWQKEGIGVAVTETSEGTRVYVTQNFC